jgi:predicted RND superfamily exporter protein
MTNNESRDIRSRIETGFSGFGHLISRRPWLFIIASIVAVAVMSSWIPLLKIDTSAEGLLNKDDSALKRYNSFRRQFGRDQMVIIGLKPLKIFNPRFLRKLKDFHHALENEVPFIDDITSLVNAEYIHGEGDELIVEGLLENLPEGPEGIKQLRERVMNDPLYQGTIISEDGTFTVIVIRPVLYSSASAAKNLPLSEKEKEEFLTSIKSVCDRFRSPDFPLYLTGDMIIEKIMTDMTVHTMLRFTLLTTLVIVIIFAILFRRISGVLLPLIVVNFALYSTLGLMAAFGVPVTLNSTVLPSFLLSVGIGDSVHMLAIYYKRLKQKGDREGAVSFTLGHSGLAVIMTSLTTAGGLLSFVNSGIAPVANLGIFAAIGVMLALAFTLVTLPALLTVTPVRKKDVNIDSLSESGLDRFLASIGDFATSHPRKIVLVSIIIFAGSMYLALQLKFSHNSLTYLKKDVPIRIATELVDREMKGSFNIEVLVDTGREYGLYETKVLNKIDQAERITESLTVEGRPVGRALAITDIIKDINRALNSGRSSEYRIPGSRELIAQELLLYEAGGGENLDKMTDRQYRKARVTVRAPWVDAVGYDRALRELDKKLKSLFNGDATASVTGLASIIVRTLSAIIRSMAESYLIAGTVITVLMILLIGNLRIGLYSMAPNFLPIVMGLGLMKLIHIPLDYSTIMVGGIAIGLAVDDTVHFMHNFRRYYNQYGDARLAVRKTLLTTGRAMLFTTIILAAAFLILLFADMNSTINFGIITGFTISVALLADFLLAPAMMVLLIKKRQT